MTESVPAYMRIRQYVVGLVAAANGVSKKIQTEQELGALFGVSRFTVRTALKELVNEGFLIQKAGLGTFVNGGKDISSAYAPGRIMTFGIIAGSGKQINYDYFTLETLAEIYKVFSRQGVRLQQLNLFHAPDKAAAEIMALKFDGILWVHPSADCPPVIATLARNKIPVMIASGNLVKAPPGNYAMLEFKQEGILAARYLLDKGHRNIIWPTDGSQPICAEFLRGVKRAYAEKKVPFDPALVIDFKGDLAVKLEIMIDLRIDFSAIFCGGMLYKIVKQVLDSKRLRIPQDVSVLAEESIYTLQVTDCNLTCLVKPLNAIGRIAARTLYDLAQGRQKKPVQIVCDWMIKEGDSCADF